MKKRLPWILVCVLSLVLIIIGIRSIPPLPFGEFGDSPDGKYLVNADDCTYGSGSIGRSDFIRIQLISKATGKIIWECNRYPQPNEEPTQFRTEGKTFIYWAADSKSFTVEMANKERIGIKVP